MVHNKKITCSGFALLITLVIISVVISIGITLIDLTIKQLRLANSSKDSESAFHAANAGVECVRYWRIASSTEFEGGTTSVPVTCFNEAATSSRLTPIPPSSPTPGVFRHDFEITWGPSTARRCSEVIMLTIASDFTSTTTLSNIDNYIDGYPVFDKKCGPGGRCSIIAVRGYNRTCANKNELGSIQREVLLDL